MFQLVRHVEEKIRMLSFFSSDLPSVVEAKSLRKTLVNPTTRPFGNNHWSVTTLWKQRMVCHGPSVTEISHRYTSPTKLPPTEIEFLVWCFKPLFSWRFSFFALSFWGGEGGFHEFQWLNLLRDLQVSCIVAPPRHWQAASRPTWWDVKLSLYC